MFKNKLTSIVASFSKTISQLEELQKQNSAAVDKNCNEVARLTTDSNNLRDESEQAQRIAGKLREILK